MRFTSQPIEEHPEVPLADDGRWEAVVDEHAQRRRGTGEAGACYVVSVGPSATRLAELLGLVVALGDRVVGTEQVRVDAPNPRTWLGSGTCEAVAARARACGARLLVVDAALSPSQARNLEDATGLAVQDREGVILAVFLRHARTRVARVQAEIAHLEYLRPRIRGLGLDMDQQAGGVMRGRGAGETASELLARQLDGRVANLRRELGRLARAAAQRRRRRQHTRRVALVGYTNAGKTSWMNALTGAGLSARDRPFETLDATSRRLTRHGGDVVIGDTVGFIRDLPERLLASFESTLAEAKEATLLVVVVDLSDPEWREHLATTDGVLARVGAAGVPRLVLFNKADRLDAPVGAEHARAADGAPWVVASCPRDVDAVRAAILGALRGSDPIVQVDLPTGSPAWPDVYRACRVLDEQATDEGVRVTIQAPEATLTRIRARIAGRTP